jgi:sulfite reductase beta subunit-like hemoprotein
MLSDAEILQALEPILISYAAEKLAGEHFEDYVHRKNIIQDKHKIELKQTL